MLYVVDDAADYRFLLEQVFKKFLPQYSVRFFADGDNLRQYVLAQGEPAQVILLDLDMPILNGYQTLRFLKRQPGWSQIPVVIMTSSMASADIGACYEAGASSFLTKPTGLDQMRQHLTTIGQYWVTMNQILQTTQPGS